MVMQQCEGITIKGNRCKKQGSVELNVYGAKFGVCSHHDDKSILSRWNRELYKRWKKDVPGGDVPEHVNGWLQSLHACWSNTRNLQVSTKYASHMYLDTELSLDFDKKFDSYVSTLVTENSTDTTECGVCMEENELTQTKCGHTYCINCIRKWMTKSTTCPMCRTIL